MKKIIILFAALAAVLSCSKENPSNYNPVDGTYSVTLTASAPGADTKTTLVDGEGTKFVHWSKGDAIKVLFFPNHMRNAGFTAPSGVFTSNFNDESSTTAYFRTDSWSWGSITPIQVSDMLMEKGIAVYPSNVNATSKKPENPYAISETDISYDLPKLQNAVKNNIESGVNFSYAEIDRSSFENTINNGTKTDLKFNNACAMIELTIPATLDKKVTSITLTSNNGLPLTGKGSVKLEYYKNVVTQPFGVNVTNGDGVTLNNANGFEAGAKYYAVVWPGNHTNGLTIVFTAEDDTKATKTTGAVELVASKVKPYTFDKGLVFESSEFDYVYSDGTFGNDVKNNIIGVVIYNGAPHDIDSGIPAKFSNGIAVYVDEYSAQWQSSQQIATSAFTSAGVQLANSTSKSSVGGYTAKMNLLALNSSYLALYNGMPSFSYSFASELYVGTTKEWDIIAADMERINNLLGDAGKTTISGNQWTANAASKLNSYYTTGNGSYSSAYATWTLATRPIFAF